MPELGKNDEEEEETGRAVVEEVVDAEGAVDNNEGAGDTEDATIDLSLAPVEMAVFPTFSTSSASLRLLGTTDGPYGSVIPSEAEPSCSISWELLEISSSSERDTSVKESDS